MGELVLVTGSGGSVGRSVAAALRAAGHRVRGFDRAPAAGDAPVDEPVVGQLEDAAAVRAAVDGCRVVVHLAAYPNPAPFVETLLGPNVLGLHHVLDAVVQCSVPRVVLASTMQVVTGHRDLGRPVSIADGPAPRNHYALTKQWAEDYGAMLAREHGVEVVAARLGWFVRNPQELRRMLGSEGAQRSYLSHADTQRFFTHAVAWPLRQKFNLVNLVSHNAGRANVTMHEARDLLGFEPRDSFPEGVPQEWLAAAQA